MIIKSIPIKMFKIFKFKHLQEVFLDESLDDGGKEVKSRWAVQRRKWAGTGSSFLLGWFNFGLPSLYNYL